MTAVYVIMGVSGSGKSTIGRALAAELGCPFFDGDDFHPPENVAKMSLGVPLDDADRATWLAQLATLLAEKIEQGNWAVLACSVLKRCYRDQLRARNEGLLFVYLQGSYDLIWQRMLARPGHYMKPEMLRSQFATLEEPGRDETDIMTLSIDQPALTIVAEIIASAIA
jgi:gluconokinase